MLDGLPDPSTGRVDLLVLPSAKTCSCLVVISRWQHW